MIFEFGKFCVDVDVERTRAFYDKHGKTVIEDCGCVNCRNYYESILTVSDKVTTFFRSLGIDPRKSPEATWWYTDENGVAYYTICFHLVGTLVNSVALCRLAGDHGMETIIENRWSYLAQCRQKNRHRWSLIEIDNGIFGQQFTAATRVLHMANHLFPIQ